MNQTTQIVLIIAGAIVAALAAYLILAPKAPPEPSKATGIEGWITRLVEQGNGQKSKALT